MLRVGDEADRKKFVVGKRVERALGLLGVTKQEAAHAMGYPDPGVVSRWCSGAERPQFDKLEMLTGWNGAYIRACAEGDPQIVIETIVKIRGAA